MINIAKLIYKMLPKMCQKAIQNVWLFLPWTQTGEHENWVRNTYVSFGRKERQKLFLSCARFMHINRPIKGYYFEFGCNEANTMRMAWDNFKYLFDLTYVGFDSFEGLPEIAEIDKQDIWEKGKLAFAEQDFITRVVSNGMPRNKLKTVCGFYDKSLTVELAADLLPQKAAVIYVDCDLYVSTVSVLKWIPPFLQSGTIIIFDDWNCFCADPNKGERRAWSEFLIAHPELQFVPFVSTAEGQAFICVKASHF